jgi:peptide/nickel transport system permease protein
MISFVLNRIIQSIFILFIVSVVVFLLLRLLPGDPLLLYRAQNEVDQLTREQIENLRHQYGLDKSLIYQYVDWVGSLAHGDFGKSLFHSEKVNTLLVQRILVTIHLGVLAMILSSILGILAGLICSLKRGRWLDTVVTSIANFGISVPIFWLGVLLIYFFSLYLKWLPVYGYTSPLQNFWLSTKQLIMPVICLSIASLAGITRQTRSSMLEIIRQDYIRTAWSKGLTERAVIIVHVLKNGLIPVITFIGINVSLIIGGSVLIESVFNIPGMGRLMVEAVFNQDYPIVQAGCLVIATMVTLTNLVVDISYGWIDPRVRYS